MINSNKKEMAYMIGSLGQEEHQNYLGSFQDTDVQTTESESLQGGTQTLASFKASK